MRDCTKIECLQNNQWVKESWKVKGDQCGISHHAVSGPSPRTTLVYIIVFDFVFVLLLLKKMFRGGSFLLFFFLSFSFCLLNFCFC